MSNPPRPDQPNPLADLFAAAADGARQAARDVANRHLREQVDAALDIVVDAVVGTVAAVADLATGCPTGPAAGDDAKAAPAASPSAQATPPAPTAEDVPPQVGDEVLIRATVIEVIPGVGVNVELFSKTDQYHAWVRSDLVTAAPRGEEVFEPRTVFVDARRSEPGEWLYLPRRAGDPEPFIVLSGPLAGERVERGAAPERLRVHISADEFDL